MGQQTLVTVELANVAQTLHVVTQAKPVLQDLANVELPILVSAKQLGLTVIQLTMFANVLQV